MKDRTLISELENNIEKEVSVYGHITKIRNHGSMAFLVVRDYTGSVQVVSKEADEWGVESAVHIKGVVKKRPEKAVRDEPQGSIEFLSTEVKVISESKGLPFDRDADVSLEVEFDHRTITLRRDREQAIFKAQHYLHSAFCSYLLSQGFTSFQFPVIVGGDAEGGSAAFEVDYFGSKAFLATSPQLYKQIMVGVFEKVYATGMVHRAEKHATSSHVNAYTSLDIEMGFIESQDEVISVLENVVREMAKAIPSSIYQTLSSEQPLIPEGSFPRITFMQACEILKISENTTDFDPEQERELSKWAKSEHNSDMLIVTHYPRAKRPFYAYPEGESSTESFDLLFRGLEMVSGGRRINEYDQMVSSMKDKGLNPDLFSFYLEAFKAGLPPHGGFGMGLERMTAQFLSLDNVKEASAFPRDRNRIDTKLHE